MAIAVGIILSILIGYLLGSISNGILIGKIFFNIDVRTMGSHNAGGTNTGRILGKKIGFLTICLDALKTTFAMWICYFVTLLIKDLVSLDASFASYFAYIAGFSACIGHSYPLYFNFKGGKTVACLVGICLATNWIICLIGLIFFFIVLISTKYVSLGSILTSILLAIMTFFPFVREYGMFFSLQGDLFYSLLFVTVAIFLTIRHHQNISRLIQGTESKVTWLSKKSK